MIPSEISSQAEVAVMGLLVGGWGGGVQHSTNSQGHSHTHGTLSVMNLSIAIKLALAEYPFPMMPCDVPPPFPRCEQLLPPVMQVQLTSLRHGASVRPSEGRRIFVLPGGHKDTPQGL